MLSHGGNVISNFFLQINGHMIKMENIRYEVGETFVILPIFCYPILKTFRLLLTFQKYYT